MMMELIRKTFDYHPDGYLTWKIRPGNNQYHIGDRAGWWNDGYEKVKIEGKDYRVSRLIYLWHHGTMPTIIDHIDQDTTNNRIENLRASDAITNQQNRGRNKNNTSGHKNVYKHGNGWRVIVSGVHGGKFMDIDNAIARARELREQLHGDFAAE